MAQLSASKDSFVFIQVETDAIVSTSFRFNERAYDSVVQKVKYESGDFRSLDAAQNGLSAHLKEAQKLSAPRLIIGFHSSLCTTAETVITIRRDDPRRLIDEAELESLVSSALWRVMSRDRAKLGRKMNTSETSVALLSALVQKVRVDGHRIASPVGFPAHTVEFTVRYTATARSLYEFLSPLLLGEREIYVTEMGASDLIHLGQQRSVVPFLFIRVSETYTYVYAGVEGELAYKDTISWGARSLIKALQNELLISEVQATHMLNDIHGGLTSAHVKRRVEALFLEELAVLFKGIGSHVGEGSYAKVYVAAPFALPESLFSPATTRKAGISVPVVPMPSHFHSAKTQSALTLDMKTGASSVSSLCANAQAAQQFFEPSDLNVVVKRRARWSVGASAK